MLKRKLNTCECCQRETYLPAPLAAAPTKGGGEDVNEEEDDYMNMTFGEESHQQPHKTESSIQRRARKQREAELKSKPKSKEELALEEARQRELGLATSLDESNKGFKMMARLGFTGGALGKEGSDARTEPITLEMKDGRGGIGLDNEKKRKIREQAAEERESAKRVKEDEDSYRERTRLEREERRREGQIVGAMKVAERLDTESKGSVGEAAGGEDGKGGSAGASGTSVPLSKVNVLWRGLVKQRVEQDRERRMRYDLLNSLTRRPAYDDEEEDKHDQLAFGKDEEEVDVEDTELDEFNEQDTETRLSQLLQYLRDTHNYCFWCKFEYPGSDMDGCPGLTEEEHD